MQVRDNPLCANCPLRGDGSQRFVADEIKPGAPVYLLMEQADPAKDPVQRVAKTYLPLAALTPEQVSVGAAIRCTAWLPKPVTAQQFEKGQRGVLENAVRYCDRVHGGVRSGTIYGPRLVVTQGDLALYAATGQRSVHEWRGWALPYQPTSDGWLSEVWTPSSAGTKPVLCTVSLGDVAAMPTLTYALRADWRKVGRILRGEWPMPWPGLIDVPPKAWPRVSAFDTEFDPETRALERYSLYAGQGQPWVIEAHNVREIMIPEPVTVVMHNEDADIEHLQKFLVGAPVRTEDTMLMHAALWSDLPHTLAYLGSIYSRINRWKHLFYRNPVVYSGADALGTWDVYAALVSEFKADPASARVYREELYPLNPIISEASNMGLRVHQGRVQQALEYHQRLRQEVILEAQAYAGYPLLLSSPDQVARHLYEVEVGIKQRRQRYGVNRHG